MKKLYLPFLCMGLLSTAVFSQNTFVTGSATVKVQPGTLFYHGGNFTVKSTATDTSDPNRPIIINSGNIRINGVFANEVSNGANFLNTYEYTGTPNPVTQAYGQVIINDGISTVLSGQLNMLTMEKKGIDPAFSTWGQFSIPYQFLTAQAAHQSLFPGISFIGSGNRYLHSFMTWDNMTRPEFDQIGSAVRMNPTDYVILNLANGSPLAGHMGDGTDVFKYAGTPANAEYSVTFRPTSYPDKPWDEWKNTQNIYREKYITYIEDQLRISTSPNYGKYFFQFGNPYTSNIDLSYIGTTSSTSGDTDNVYVKDLAGVVKIQGVDWTRVDGSEVGTAYRRASYNTATNTWGGDADALIIRPFETFIIGLTATATREERTFLFNDGLKTFSSTPKLTPTGGFTPTPKASNNEILNEGNDFENRNQQNLNQLSHSVLRTSFYQLGLNLYTEDDVKTGNVVYVIVDGNSQSGIAEPLEANYSDFYKGFFLTQEKADGSEVTSPNQVMQINAVNSKYIAKPIPLFFKTSEDDYNGYIVKADLFYQNIFNKLKQEDVNFADGNSFFFYDKEQDVLMPVTTDFSYYIERPSEATSSRYVVYWNGGPAQEKRMDVSEQLADLTQIYKDGDVHKIRFNEAWTSADVSVYDLSGRSIFKKEGINTEMDYTLDLPKTIAYVVKIVSNTGEVVTQKILN